MFWNVASAQYGISLRKRLVVLRTLEGALIVKNALCWQQGFFSLVILYTLYEPGVSILVQCKSHLQKTKNTGEPQNQFVVSTQIR